ncbi:hypothetical protein OEIGOIKO_00079 [Streptomyces chrestomyceticus JCM 4735]|uniref:Uncharacterized protein n=1 Tax=Streptomyces chrestomyceticus JCM 4735 TaxID=1306181 RepID=A0A7U9KN82_9ACTN|nr:hypothetical protein OEIGOIKO_00079 [Streptomyces chrestomyceticus JCM 4735]
MAAPEGSLHAARSPRSEGAGGRRIEIVALAVPRRPAGSASWIGVCIRPPRHWGGRLRTGSPRTRHRVRQPHQRWPLLAVAAAPDRPQGEDGAPNPCTPSLTTVTGRHEMAWPGSEGRLRPVASAVAARRRERPRLRTVLHGHGSWPRRRSDHAEHSSDGAMCHYRKLRDDRWPACRWPRDRFTQLLDRLRRYLTIHAICTNRSLPGPKRTRAHPSTADRRLNGICPSASVASSTAGPARSVSQSWGQSPGPLGPLRRQTQPADPQALGPKP